MCQDAEESFVFPAHDHLSVYLDLLPLSATCFSFRLSALAAQLLRFELSRNIQQMCKAIFSTFQLGDTAKVLRNLLLQVEILEPLQEHPHAMISALEESDDPRVIGAGHFTDTVKVRIGVGL